MIDLDERETAADGIEEGKRLIRLGGDKGLSLAERVAERLYRLSWRTPIHSVRLKGRHPLKLIAVPDDPLVGPIAGSIERGDALVAGSMVFAGEQRDIKTLNLAKPDYSRRFGNYLHSFAWLRDLAAVATRQQAAPIAEGLMRRWLEQHADVVSEPAWRPDLWGRRVQFWTAHAPLILSSTDLVYRSRVLNTLARGARHLDGSADKVAPGAGRIAAWCGVVTAGLLIPAGDTRRRIGETGLTRAIQASVFADGGIVARAPLAQLDVLMLLTLLRSAYQVRRMETPAAIDETLARMVPALLGICHADKGLSSWQGGGPMRGADVEAIVAATGVRARPLRQARDWGYQRLAGGATVIVVDAAPPPVARLVEGGCGSTLAFEMSDGPHRLIVNCGGARTMSIQVPAALAEGLRTTAAHSTLVVGDSNSTAIHSDGTLGKGVVEVELNRQESDTSSRIEASHDGYAKRYGFVHRRQLMLTSDGRDLRGEDMLLPVGRRRKQSAAGFAVRFHLAPGVQVSPTADGQAALLRLPAGGPLWQFRCRGGALSVEDSLWVDADGHPHATLQIVISGESPAGGTNVSWALKRAI